MKIFKRLQEGESCHVSIFAYKWYKEGKVWSLSLSFSLFKWFLWRIEVARLLKYDELGTFVLVENNLYFN